MADRSADICVFSINSLLRLCSASDKYDNLLSYMTNDCKEFGVKFQAQQSSIFTRKGGDMQRFQNRTVIVTGGGGGIGGATCRRFGREGARVAVFDLNYEAARKVAAAEAKLGPIDVLVNNAGWDVFRPFTKTEPAQWDKLIAINLTGALHMHHA